MCSGRWSARQCSWGTHAGVPTEHNQHCRCPAKCSHASICPGWHPAGYAAACACGRAARGMRRIGCAQATLLTVSIAVSRISQARHAPILEGSPCWRDRAVLWPPYHPPAGQTSSSLIQRASLALRPFGSVRHKIRLSVSDCLCACYAPGVRVWSLFGQVWPPWAAGQLPSLWRALLRSLLQRASAWQPSPRPP